MVTNKSDKEKYVSKEFHGDTILLNIMLVGFVNRNECFKTPLNMHIMSKEVNSDCINRNKTKQKLYFAFLFK